MRSIHPDTLTALQQPIVRFLLLVRFHLDATTIAWNTGFSDLDFDGYTYLGTGNLGSIGNLNEVAEPKPNALNVTLSGVDPAVIAAFASEAVVNRPAVIHVAVVNEALAVIGEPFLLFAGKIDPADVSIGQEATVGFSIRSRLSDWERPLVSRYTHEDQQLRYPGDRGFEFVEQLAMAEIEWPGKGFAG